MTATIRLSRKARPQRCAPAPAQWSPRPLALALALVGTTAGAQVPTGFTPVRGMVDSPVMNGNTMSIYQRSERAIIEWNSFSIGPGNAVRFQQPGASSMALNRVVGGDLSHIAGSLSANGKVFLINPAGVLFSAGSRVDTGGLVASTLNIANDDFMAGRFTFERDPANAASVVNRGTLSAPGSTVALMAATVVNEGTVQADGGTVGLVSARKVSLDFQGDGLTTFRFDPAAKADAAFVGNAVEGVLQANGGRVAVLADSSQVAQLVVNQQGTVRARSISERNGEIILGGAPSADVRVAGTLDVRGEGAGASGGTITVQAGGIRATGAVMDASGPAGGGQVELSAGRAVTLDAATRLHADALARGDGGRIQVDAGDGGLHVAGRLSADAAEGDGGRIATSAAVVEVGAAQVSASGGRAGRNGSWRAASQADVTIGTAPAGRPASEVSAADFSQVSAEALGEALGKGTDVTVAATGFPLNGRGESGNVVFEENAAVVKRSGGESTLRVDAMRDIDMGPRSRIESQAGALNVAFNADSSGTAKLRSPVGSSVVEEERGGSIMLDSATIVTRGGDVRFFGQSDPVDGRASGSVSFVAGRPRTRHRGIDISTSRIDTCAEAGCASGGSFHASGQGLTTVDETAAAGVEGGTGVFVSRTDIIAGRDIEISGHGGVGAAGVIIDGTSEGPAEGVLSAAGNIALRGTAEDATGSASLVRYSVDPGVALIATGVVAGGDIVIEGTGSNLQAMTESEEGRKLLGDGTIGAVDGVYLADTAIAAGAGRSVRIVGEAGSDGIVGDPGGAYGTIRAHGVRVEQRLEVGTLPSSTVAASGGSVEITGRGSDVWIGGAGGELVPRVDVSSETGRGGDIRITGRNIALQGETQLAANGAGGAGRISVRADGIASVGQQVRVQANGSGASAAGGEVLLYGDEGLRAHGTVQARGAGTARGGYVETSGGALDLRGVRVDAGSERGSAGTWLVDPYDVDVVHGAAAGSLPSNPFEPIANSTIQDGDINAALDAGTSVTISTGTGGDPAQGFITLQNGVEIRRTTGTGALDLTFNAHHGIAGEGFLIESTAGELNLAFNSNASGTQPDAASIALSNAQLRTNGGSVSMYGQSDPAAGHASSIRGPAISLGDTVIDTRIGQSDASAGGAVVMRGSSNGLESISISGGSIQSSTGDVTVRGVTGGTGDGVMVQAGNEDALIATTTGNIAITGLGGGDASFSASGVVLAGAHVQTVDGTIDVRGLAQGASTEGAGVVMEGASLVVQGAGRAWVTGQSEGSGAGIDMQGGTSASSAYAIDGGSQAVVLRADNDGGADAIAINAPVRSGAAINLRPGGVDADGNALDHASTSISAGGPGQAGFSVSTPEVAYLEAPELILGSAAHAGNISVDGAVPTAGNLTLQNEGGGAIALNGQVSAQTVALLAGASVTQSASGGVSAETLLVRTPAGGASLVAGSNDVRTLAAQASGNVNFRGAGNLAIGTAAAVGMGPGDTLQAAAASGVNAANAVVQATSGNLAVQAASAATGGLTLQADAGNVSLGQSVQASTVALLAGGDITQATAGTVTAAGLLARSPGGNVQLDAASNRTDTVAGGAANGFAYTDVDALRIGEVAASRQDADGNLASATASGIAADATVVQTLAGDLTLDATVTGRVADLVAAERFQNPNSAAIATTESWRVWANTWEGETRGGLSGSGPLPNLYNRGYGAAVGDGDNHFIYRQQPTVTITLDSASRPAGQENPPLGYTVSGLILGDTGAGISGAAGTSATATSPAGAYAVTAVTPFVSAEGYAINLVPGLLTVTSLDLPGIDVYREMPTTYLYDRNLAPVAMCFATGPLAGDKAEQAGDLLAREWSRVKTRPHLSNCVATDKTNACANF